MKKTTRKLRSCQDLILRHSRQHLNLREKRHETIKGENSKDCKVEMKKKWNFARFVFILVMFWCLVIQTYQQSELLKQLQ
jgi:hypothetical protein